MIQLLDTLCNINFQKAGESGRQTVEQLAINNTEPHPTVDKIYMKPFHGASMCFQYKEDDVF